MSKPIERVEIITGIHRRRRYTAEEKVRLVEQTMQPGMTVSAVARLQGVSPSLPLLNRPEYLQGCAAVVAGGEHLRRGADRAHAAQGRLLQRPARHLDLDSEMALKRTNAKFQQRFSHIEDRLAEQGIPFNQASLEQMEALWVEAKQRQKAGT